jgi:hypothetical protein
MLNPIQQQLCFAHGIQLLVFKVLYQKASNQILSTHLTNNDELDSEVPKEESDDFEDAISDWDSQLIIETELADNYSINTSYLKIIEKCRSLIKIF